MKWTLTCQQAFEELKVLLNDLTVAVQWDP